MSIVERLFPASELEALRAVPYDFDLEPFPKRRKLTSSLCEPTLSTRRTSSDSGYESDESCPVPESWLAPRKRSRTSMSSTSSQASSPASTQTQFTQSALFPKYLSTLSPTDSADDRPRTQSGPLLPTPEKLKEFYDQITLARSRSRASVDGLPTPPFSNGGSAHTSPSNHTVDQSQTCIGNVGQGWTAGPKSALEAQLSARLFDGIRITSDERSLLHSLIPERLPPSSATMPPLRRRTRPAFSYPQRRAVQISMPAPVKTEYAGIAMPAGAYDDDDDDFVTPDLDGYTFVGEATGKVEDFFNIEEASDDGPSVPVKIET